MSLVAVTPRSLLPLASWIRALRRPADHRWSCAVIVFALCGVLFFYGINSGELWRTESLRAIIAADFLRSGDWAVPTLYGEPLLTKPPGIYAAIALASWPFGGVSEWTARLPSALAATATVLLFGWHFGRQLGRLAGLVAAVVLPTSFMWLDKVPTAEIDMLQVAWVSAAVVCFLRALECEEERGEDTAALAGGSRLNGWWLLAMLCVAGGVLTKWTAPVFFYATAVPLLWWRRRLRLLVRRGHLVGVALAATVCFAWAGMVLARVGWEPLYETVSREALQRLSPSLHHDIREQMGAHHHSALSRWGEVLAHPLRVLATNLPWSAVALLTLRPGFAKLWDERGRRLLQAMHCWTWPSLLFWSVLPEHALRHSFPLFPGIAGLAAMLWIAWLNGSLRWPVPRLGPGRVLAGVVVGWLVVKVLFVGVVVPMRNGDRQPRAKGEQIAACVPADRMLYLLRLKDEGIMFYYGRAVRRLAGPECLPSGPEPVYCILDEMEWRQWAVPRQAEVLLWLRDEQGAPAVLVRVAGPEPGT
jgi:4-amino-4-deoxy-L-arabinose transferase-like glycosyltransferase